MSGEFEVQIRDGKVTNDGKSVLRQLSHESHQFQYKSRISDILFPWIQQLSGHPIQLRHSSDMSAIIPGIIDIVEKILTRKQQENLAARRNSNHQLCKEKCEAGPAIHNFTNFIIPDIIKRMLGPGLQVVPNHTRSIEEVRDTILSDMKKAAIAYFRSTMGYKPTGVDKIKSLDEVLQFLSMKTPCGSPKSEFYFKMRELHVSMKDDFMSNLDTKNDVRDPLYLVQKLLPPEVVITPTDKNLGVAFVPISWFQLQYDSQCEKGNYAKSEMDTGECIRHLENKVLSLWGSLNTEQTKLLRSSWPKQYNKVSPCIGVMKLVPKVHKLKEVNLESWKILTSRPIRGAENCPLNPASKVSPVSVKHIFCVRQGSLFSFFPRLYAHYYKGCRVIYVSCFPPSYSPLDISPA